MPSVSLELPKGRILWDFEAREGTDELMVKENQIVTISQRYGYDLNDNEWWKVESDGKLGFVPSSYVSVLSDQSPQTDPTPKSVALANPFLVIACYAYTASKPGELTFASNDQILVIQQNSAGWWTGKFGEQTGLFPVNYVQMIDQSNTEEEKEQDKKQEKQEKKEKKEKKIDKKTTLEPPVEPTSKQKRTTPTKPLPNPPEKKKPTLPKESTPEPTKDTEQNNHKDNHSKKGTFLFTAIALFPYKATYEDELSFKKGDIVTIKAAVMDGWFKGTVNNNPKEGLLPGNYLKQVNDHSQEKTEAPSSKIARKSQMVQFWQDMETSGKLTIPSAENGPSKPPSEKQPLLSNPPQKIQQTQKSSCCVIV